MPARKWILNYSSICKLALYQIFYEIFYYHTGVGLISQDPFSLDGVSRVPKSPSRAYV